VFDADAREVWQLINGLRSIVEINDEIAAAEGLAPDEVDAAVTFFCAPRRTGPDRLASSHRTTDPVGEQVLA